MQCTYQYQYCLLLSRFVRPSKLHFTHTHTHIHTHTPRRCCTEATRVTSIQIKYNLNHWFQPWLIHSFIHSCIHRVILSLIQIFPIGNKFGIWNLNWRVVLLLTLNGRKKNCCGCIAYSAKGKDKKKLGNRRGWNICGFLSSFSSFSAFRETVFCWVLLIYIMLHLSNHLELNHISTATWCLQMMVTDR